MSEALGDWLDAQDIEPVHQSSKLKGVAASQQGKDSDTGSIASSVDSYSKPKSTRWSILSKTSKSSSSSFRTNASRTMSFKKREKTKEKKSKSKKSSVTPVATTPAKRSQSQLSFDTTIFYDETELRAMPEAKAARARVNYVLEHPVMSQAFKKYAASNYCAENVLFALKALAFPKIKDEAKRQHVADQIFEWHLDDEAQMEVNISAHLRNSIIQRMEDNTIGPDLYELALKEIMTMLQQCLLPEYVKSEHFLSCLKKIYNSKMAEKRIAGIADKNHENALRATIERSTSRRPNSASDLDVSKASDNGGQLEGDIKRDSTENDQFFDIEDLELGEWSKSSRKGSRESLVNGLVNAACDLATAITETAMPILGLQRSSNDDLDRTDSMMLSISNLMVVDADDDEEETDEPVAKTESTATAADATFLSLDNLAVAGTQDNEEVTSKTSEMSA
eukprot:Clim_evm101s108 gene=Clim_evmTU101s108